MNVTLRMEYHIPTVKYGKIMLDAAVELGDDDLVVAPDDRRDPIDIAMERASDAIDQLVAIRLQSLVDNNVAEDKNHVIKIIKTLNAFQESAQ